MQHLRKGALEQDRLFSRESAGFKGARSVSLNTRLSMSGSPWRNPCDSREFIQHIAVNQPHYLCGGGVSHD